MVLIEKISEEIMRETDRYSIRLLSSLSTNFLILQVLDLWTYRKDYMGNGPKAFIALIDIRKGLESMHSLKGCESLDCQSFKKLKNDEHAFVTYTQTNKSLEMRHVYRCRF